MIVMDGWIPGTGLAAAFWGFVIGSALLIGACLGYFFRISQRVNAGVMAFGSGILISALSFDLMEEAFEGAGPVTATAGFLTGAAVFSVANWFLASWGGKHRKRSGHHQLEESRKKGSGFAITLGAILDGIPESIAVGLTMIGTGKVNLVAVVAIFISNIPEGLSSTQGMKRAGRSAFLIFGIWSSMIVLTTLGSLAGYHVFEHLAPHGIAFTMAFAAGAILAMLMDTMIPEAFEGSHNFSGLIGSLGFLTGFALDHFISLTRI